MTDMVMMMLGAFKFKISTAAYQRLRRSTDYRWPVQERLGREPARQFVGQGNDKIDLEGVIYPQFKGGLNQVSQMRDMAGKGQPLRLMASSSGKGVSWGNWCIEQIEETQETFFWDGVPRKIEFHLSLAKYGD
jgi:phage protein U